MRWYAAKTKSGQDKVAIDNLKRQGFEVYYPRVLVNVRNDSEALFPGYVLIRFDLASSAWRVINNTRGISRLLAFNEDGVPTSLPDKEIEQLQLRESAGELRIPEARHITRGDRVKVLTGASVDMIGEVISTRGERVQFLLHLLGRKVKCIAPEHALAMVVSPRGG